MNYEELVKAFKDKRYKDVLELIVVARDEELANEVKEAGRLTNALVERTLGKLNTIEAEPEDTFEEPLPEFADAAIEMDTLLAVLDAQFEELDAQFEDAQFEELDALIAKGKKKKAKKLFKAMTETGIKGSEMDKRKELIKGL